MNNGFTKGLMIGSIIGASVGAMFGDQNIMKNNSGPMRMGEAFMRRIGKMFTNMADMSFPK